MGANYVTITNDDHFSSATTTRTVASGVTSAVSVSRHQRNGQGSHSGRCEVSFRIRFRHSRHAFRASVESAKLRERRASMDERSNYVRDPRDTNVRFVEGLRREREREKALTGQRGEIRRLCAASQAQKLLQTLRKSAATCVRPHP